MKILRCPAVRRRLEAFHDGELPVGERHAVATHLHECPICAREARAIATVAAAVKEEAHRRVPESPTFCSMRDAIVGRLQAERDESLPVRFSRMFEDMHLVWAGLSATAATVACAALLFAIWFLSPPERDDSLAGVMSALAAPAVVRSGAALEPHDALETLLSALASPGSDRTPVALDQRVRLPRVSDGIVLPAMLTADASQEDLVFALAAVVTQEGRIASSEVLRSNHSGRDALMLMNAINAARFQPASLRGSPVAVNLVWLLTHTTVRGKIHS